nr:putative receptor-like protein kinase At3g47110 [Quercus suber]
MGGEASTEGDVYSYGVLVLEMFIGRRPTDVMFKDGLNLHNFVKMSLPKRLIQVVDPMLLPREVEEIEVPTATMMATKEDDNDNEIVEEANNTEDFRHIDVDMQKCLLSILNIGILCSLESPKERINMEEVIKELQLIKSTFVGLGIRRGRPSRAQRPGTTRRD